MTEMAIFVVRTLLELSLLTCVGLAKLALIAVLSSRSLSYWGKGRILAV